ncbi:c-type cytochrome [Novosphingobium lentum]|uniref:c-type cytochrome n=1 Tax=Novosphingobium lentum TaxID=145287 RepID=UPI00082E4589|nr:cytochrome c [Novosphingobium lentum]
MRRTVLIAAALVMAGAGTAWAAGQQLGQPLAPRSPEKVYASTCGYCHGTNVGPIILGRHLPAVTVVGMVREGRNAMPAFRPTEISNGELEALSRWVEASAANPQEKGQ